MTASELKRSATTEPAPPCGISPEAEALWFAKAGKWEEAHTIAQDIDSRAGSWIHALLHLMEGDAGNAGYWFRQAGRPTVGPGQIDAEWDRIATDVLGPA